MQLKPFPSLLLAALIATVLTACGGSDDVTSTTDDTPPANSGPRDPNDPPAPVDQRTLRIYEDGDSLTYSVTGSVSDPQSGNANISMTETVTYTADGTTNPASGALVMSEVRATSGGTANRLVNYVTQNSSGVLNFHGDNSGIWVNRGTPVVAIPSPLTNGYTEERSYTRTRLDGLSGGWSEVSAVTSSSLETIETDPISTPAGSFDPVFRLTLLELEDTLHSFKVTQRTMWIFPPVGIVQEQLSQRERFTCACPQNGQTRQTDLNKTLTSTNIPFVQAR